MQTATQISTCFQVGLGIALVSASLAISWLIAGLISKRLLYFDVPSEAFVAGIEAEAAEVIESIKNLAAAAPTPFDIETDSLALKQELAEIEADHLQQVQVLDQELAWSLRGLSK